MAIANPVFDLTAKVDGEIKIHVEIQGSSDLTKPHTSHFWKSRAPGSFADPVADGTATVRSVQYAKVTTLS